VTVLALVWTAVVPIRGNPHRGEEPHDAAPCRSQRYWTLRAGRTGLKAVSIARRSSGSPQPEMVRSSLPMAQLARCNR
jgi:hypothetical protein